MVKAIEYFREEYPKRKSVLNTKNYDDLLINVSTAIEPDESLLLAMMRKQFNAVLVDEFQDTDPVQYGIFKRAFGDAKKPLFMIGDPKQAIYGFRGGDIYTYLKAKDELRDESGREYTIGTNFRSSPEMINGVNSICF